MAWNGLMDSLCGDIWDIMVTACGALAELLVVGLG